MAKGSHLTSRLLTLLKSHVIIAVLLVATTGWWLFRLRWPLGKKDEWLIHVQSSFWPLSAWLLPLSVLGIFGGLAALAAYDRFHRAQSRSAQTASTAISVGALCLLSLLWPWSLLGQGGVFNVVAVTWSDVANEYFSTAYQIEDVRKFTSTYAQERQQPPTRYLAHVATHPPGATLFYYGARRVFESSPVLQNLFTDLTEKITNESVANMAPVAQQLRRSSAIGAGAVNLPATLPSSAVPGAVWCAFLIALATTTIVPAAYLLGATTTDGDWDEAGGLCSAAFFALAPSVAFFSFTLDALIACGTAWTLVFFSRRLCNGSMLWVALAGLLIGFTSFLSFGALTVSAILILALLIHYGIGMLAVWHQEPAPTQPDANVRVRHMLSDLAILAAGFVVAWLILMVLFPMQPLAIFKNAMAVHRMATVTMRTYSFWVWMNPVTFFLFCGWPLTVAMLIALHQNFKKLLAVLIAAVLMQRLKQVLADIPTPLNVSDLREPGIVLGWATLLTIVLLTLSGNVLGEVERLWLFLLVPVCSLAAFNSSQWPESNKLRVGAVSMMLLLQATQTLVMAASLSPIARP